MHRSSNFYSLVILVITAKPIIANNLLSYADGISGHVLGSAFSLPGINISYDYMVIGGGTVGFAIATRLADDASVTVAVIKAGGFYKLDNGNLSVMPGYANFYEGADANKYQPLVNWDFTTTPQAVSHYPSHVKPHRC